MRGWAGEPGAAAEAGLRPRAAPPRAGMRRAADAQPGRHTAAADAQALAMANRRAARPCWDEPQRRLPLHARAVHFFCACPEDVRVLRKELMSHTRRRDGVWSPEGLTGSDGMGGPDGACVAVRVVVTGRVRWCMGCGAGVHGAGAAGGDGGAPPPPPPCTASCVESL